MVSTVRPKASETPTRPMPISGNFAASTALPQPPNTSQKVPMNSAPSFFDSGMTSSPACRRVLRGRRCDLVEREALRLGADPRHGEGGKRPDHGDHDEHGGQPEPLLDPQE